MGNFTIYPLHVGDLNRQKSNLAYMREPGVKIDFPLICWYLTDGTHKVMVDTRRTTAGSPIPVRRNRSRHALWNGWGSIPKKSRT